MVPHLLARTGGCGLVPGVESLHKWGEQVRGGLQTIRRRHRGRDPCARVNPFSLIGLGAENRCGQVCGKIQENNQYVLFPPLRHFESDEQGVGQGREGGL